MSNGHLVDPPWDKHNGTMCRKCSGKKNVGGIKCPTCKGRGYMHKPNQTSACTHNMVINQELALRD